MPRGIGARRVGQRLFHHQLEDRHGARGAGFLLAERCGRVEADEHADHQGGREADEPGVLAIVVVVPTTPVVVVPVPEVPPAVVVVASSTCSGAPNSGAVPWKMARIAFMFLPLSAGTRTALPPMFALVLSTW